LAGRAWRSLRQHEGKCRLSRQQACRSGTRSPRPATR
jgi:hypothetical protein